MAFTSDQYVTLYIFNEIISEYTQLIENMEVEETFEAVEETFEEQEKRLDFNDYMWDFINTHYSLLSQVKEFNKWIYNVANDFGKMYCKADNKFINDPNA